MSNHYFVHLKIITIKEYKKEKYMSITSSQQFLSQLNYWQINFNKFNNIERYCWLLEYILYIHVLGSENRAEHKKAMALILREDNCKYWREEVEKFLI